MQTLVTESRATVKSPAMVDGDELQIPGYTRAVSTTLSERLLAVIALRNVDQRTFATRAGLNASYVSAYLFRAKAKADSKFDRDHLRKIAKTWEVDFDWLRSGIGRAPEGLEIASSAEVAATPAPEGHALQRALGLAFDPARHEVVDLRYVDDLMGQARFELAADGDLVAAARRWLDAAAGLRRDNLPRSPQAMLLRLALDPGAAPTPEARRALATRADEQRKALDAEVPRAEMEPPARPRGRGKGRG